MTDTPAADAVLFPRVIDNTMRSDWIACPHRFFRRHCQGLSSDAVNVHLHFGGAMARGLEVARRTFAAGEPPRLAVAAGAEALIRAWGTFEPPPIQTRTAANKTLDAALVALAEYFTEWPLDTDPVQIHHHNGEPAIEFSFAVPIPGSRHPVTGEPLLYAGRFDLIGDYAGGVWGLDDKTTSSLGDHWRAQWRLRGQFTGYVWGAREYGLRLAGFVVRGICILKDNIKLDHVVVARPDWMVDAWLAQLQDDVRVMCEQFLNLTEYGGAASDGHPFRQAFDNACSDFNGCSFIDLCTSPTPDNWISQFAVRRWDPLLRQEA